MIEADLYPFIERIANAPHSGMRLWRANAGRWRVLRPGGRLDWVKGMPNGTADFVGIANGGLYLELEIKGPRTKVTSAQKSRQRLIRKMGGVYCIFRMSKDWTLEESAKMSLEMLKEQIESTLIRANMNGSETQ